MKHLSEAEQRIKEILEGRLGVDGESTRVVPEHGSAEIVFKYRQVVNGYWSLHASVTVGERIIINSDVLERVLEKLRRDDRWLDDVRGGTSGRFVLIQPSGAVTWEANT